MKYDRLVNAFILGCLIAPSASAQVAKWAVLPKYENIKLLESGLYQIKQQGKVGLIDGSGNAVLPMEYDSIMPFSEGHAPVIKDGKFVAIVDYNGKIQDVTKGGYEIVPGMGGFSSGFMPVLKDGSYFYLNTTGDRLVGPFIDAYPFYEGKAVARSVCSEASGELQFDVINPSFDIIPISGVEPGDISFISSFNNGKAICIAKKKVYTIDGSSMMAVPLALDPSDVKKSAVEMLRKEVIPVPDGESGYVLGAKNGLFRFDRSMRLRRIELTGKDPEDFKLQSDKEPEYKTNLATIEDNGLYGLTFRGDVILPPQFDEVGMLCGNRAVVARDGEYGVVVIDTDNQLVFKLNNNEPIGFNHQFYNGNLTMVMPSYINCENARIIDRTNTCDIQIDTRKENKSIEGNSLSYDCRIAIPADASDALQTYEYKFALKYDGLLSADFPVRVPAWYIRDYDVKVAGTGLVPNTTDRILVDLDLNKGWSAGDDNGMYYRRVDVVGPDNMLLPVEKKTENRYSFQMGSVTGNNASFTVLVTEAGCPTVQYPFELIVDRANLGKIDVLKTDAPDPTLPSAPGPQQQLYGQTPQMTTGYAQSQMQGMVQQPMQVQPQNAAYAQSQNIPQAMPQNQMYSQPQQVMQPQQVAQPMQQPMPQTPAYAQPQQVAQPMMQSQQPAPVYTQPQVYAQPQPQSQSPVQAVPVSGGYYQSARPQTNAAQPVATQPAPVAQATYR